MELVDRSAESRAESAIVYPDPWPTCGGRVDSGAIRKRAGRVRSRTTKLTSCSSRCFRSSKRHARPEAGDARRQDAHRPAEQRADVVDDRGVGRLIQQVEHVDHQLELAGPAEPKAFRAANVPERHVVEPCGPAWLR